VAGIYVTLKVEARNEKKKKNLNPNSFVNGKLKKKTKLSKLLLSNL